VFQVLAPLWVDPASAAALRTSLAEQRPRPTRFVALPVQDRALTAFEAEMLVRRANPLPDDADDPCDHVARRIDQKLGATLSAHLQDDEGGCREDRLDQLRRVDYPVYVVLRFPVDLGLAELLARPAFVAHLSPPRPRQTQPLPARLWSGLRFESATTAESPQWRLVEGDAPALTRLLKQMLLQARQRQQQALEPPPPA
jgi:hypothetical protein